MHDFCRNSIFVKYRERLQTHQQDQAGLCRKDLNGYRADISDVQQTFGTQWKDVFIKEVNQHSILNIRQEVKRLHNTYTIR